MQIVENISTWWIVLYIYLQYKLQFIYYHICKVILSSQKEVVGKIFRQSFDYSKTTIGINIFMISANVHGKFKKDYCDINGLYEFNEDRLQW